MVQAKQIAVGVIGGVRAAARDAASWTVRLWRWSRQRSKLSGCFVWLLVWPYYLVFVVAGFPFLAVLRSPIRAGEKAALIVLLGLLYFGLFASDYEVRVVPRPSSNTSSLPRPSPSAPSAEPPPTSVPGPAAVATVAPLPAPALPIPSTETPSAATPAAAVVSRPPATPPPVAYSVVQRRDFSFGGRTRYGIRVVVPGSPTTAQKISTLAHIARTELRAHVISVVAYRSTAELAAGGKPTVGRAWVSTDGLGWAADGEFIDGPDDGSIVGAVVLAVDEWSVFPISEQRFAVHR